MYYNNLINQYGKGLLKNIRSINSIIFDALVGLDARSQKNIDAILLSLDGTKNKKKLESYKC